MRLLLQLEVKISKTFHNYKSNFPKILCIYITVLNKKRTINKEHKLSSHTQHGLGYIVCLVSMSMFDLLASNNKYVEHFIHSCGLILVTIMYTIQTKCANKGRLEEDCKLCIRLGEKMFLFVYLYDAVD